MKKIKLAELLRNRNLPILVILLVFLVLGVFLYPTLGASLDEPDYYVYGTNTLHAYSIADRLNGTFNINAAFEPNDLRFYGPAFLIFGAGIQNLFLAIFPQALPIDGWHFTIYLTFFASAFFLFKLAQRWVGQLAATLATLLYLSQPVLFGMAWMDPKDIPLVTFFAGTIYFGLMFMDESLRLFGAAQNFPLPASTLAPSLRGIKSKGQRGFFSIGLVLTIIEGALLLAAAALQGWLTQAILTANLAAPTSLFEKLFARLAQHSSDLPLALYANKASLLFERALMVGGVVTVVVDGVAVLLMLDSQCFKKLGQWLKHFWLEFSSGYKHSPRKLNWLASFIGACVMLGFACATRIIGPMAAMLVILVWVIRLKKKSLPLILAFALVSFLIFWACWPFLWPDLFGNLLQALKQMMDFPVGMQVLFNGIKYDSRALPSAYLPQLLLLTSTEPALLLFGLGVIVAILRFIKKSVQNRVEILIPLLWFFFPLLYVVLRRPPLYDNYRHFLFLLPAAAVLCAFALDWLFSRIKSKWLNVALILVVLLPGFMAEAQLHPYEYAYYNLLAGGVPGAAGKYEVDYWLTCYKDLTEQINANEKEDLNVYVDSTPALVKYYANDNITVKGLDNIRYPSNSLIILPSRWQHVLLYPDYPVAYTVQLQGVVLCEAKRVP
ncbi:MAG: hypothetical protein VB013_04480 [Anaerolineaceae bacterium]|nr:hypothetical protein [Anaerolineaceae bacterium]